MKITSVEPELSETQSFTPGRDVRCVGSTRFLCRPRHPSRRWVLLSSFLGHVGYMVCLGVQKVEENFEFWTLFCWVGLVLCWEWMMTSPRFRVCFLFVFRHFPGNQTERSLIWLGSFVDGYLSFLGYNAICLDEGSLNMLSFCSSEQFNVFISGFDLYKRKKN